MLGACACLFFFSSKLCMLNTHTHSADEICSHINIHIDKKRKKERENEEVLIPNCFCVRIELLTCKHGEQIEQIRCCNK